jgi:hypothetical protein
VLAAEGASGCTWPRGRQAGGDGAFNEQQQQRPATHNHIQGNCLDRKERPSLLSSFFLFTGAWSSHLTPNSDNDPNSCSRVRNHLLQVAINRLTITNRIFEDDSTSVVEIRTENLQALRELGPPDLVHLVKQPVKSTTKQVPLQCAEAS